MTLALGLTAALCWALDNLLSVRVSRSMSAVVALAWMLAIGLVETLAVSLVIGGTLDDWSWHDVAVVAASGPTYLIAFAAFLRSLRRGSLSVIAPIIALEGGVAALLAAFLGESVRPLTACGLGVAVLGSVLASAERGRRTAAGTGWALLSAFCYGLTFLLYGEVRDFSPLDTVILSRLSALILLVPWIIGQARQLRLASAIVPFALATGTLDAVAFMLFSTAVSIGPISVASVSAAQFAVLAAVLGVVVLGERLALWQYAGVGLTLIAVSILSVE